MYTLYKNESFTEKSLTKQRRSELGILGPVIRAQIRDVITVRPHLFTTECHMTGTGEYNAVQLKTLLVK